MGVSHLLCATVFGIVLGYAVGSTYTAAVVQHEAVKGGNAEDTIRLNFERYFADARVAAQSKADVIVFPEWGLFGDDIPSVCPSSASGDLEYCQVFPSASSIEESLASLQQGGQGINACENPEGFDSVMLGASCLAKNASAYVSINACDRNGGLNYNAQVVFDRAGNLVAKYYKSHPFFPKCFAKPTEPDYVTFKTDFGVTFGVFTCFDILFSTPGPVLAKNGIKHFVYSAAIPLVGEAAQSLWTLTYKATMLASNADNGQSGVFVGGHRTTPKPTSTEDVLIAQVAV